MKAISRGVPIAVLMIMMPAGRFMAANQPPTACFTATPSSGTVATAFSVDAGCSTDDHTAASKLKVRWDWENDGVWDTALSTTKTANHQYPTEGTDTIKVEVVDQSSVSSTTTRMVSVLPTLTQALIAESTWENFWEPDVDVNPVNSQNLVVSAFAAVEPMPAFVSNNGGASWTRATGIRVESAGDPGIEFDSAGQAFLMTLDTSSTYDNQQGVVVTRSTDGGYTYPSSVFAMDDNTNFRFPDGSFHTPCTLGVDPWLYDYSKIAVDKNAGSPRSNYIYVSAKAMSFDVDGNGQCEYGGYGFIRSTDGGISWDSAQIIDGIGAGQTSGIGIAPNGTIYLADASSSTPFCPGGVGVALRKSDNGGATFQPATCAYSSDGSIPPDRTWTTVDPADASRVYVAFNARVPSMGSTNHVYVIRSADGGNSWSTPVRLDGSVPNDVVDHYRPSISVGAGGRVDVIWFDYRNSSPTVATQNGQPGDVYYAYSKDRGVTWSSNIRLSTSTSPLMWGGHNDFLTVASSGLKGYAVYSQDTNGNGFYEVLMTIITFH